MFLLAGGVRFASPDGSVLSAHAGDALFVPQGAPIGWESSERVAKFYVVQERACLTAAIEIQPCPSHCASSRLRPTRLPVPTSS